MTFSMRFPPPALTDVESAQPFYETIQKHLRIYCTDSLLSDIESLPFDGGMHLKTGKYHRLLSKRLPFSIDYKVKKNHRGDRDPFHQTKYK